MACGVILDSNGRVRQTLRIQRVAGEHDLVEPRDHVVARAVSFQRMSLERF